VRITQYSVFSVSLYVIVSWRSAFLIISVCYKCLIRNEIYTSLASIVCNVLHIIVFNLYLLFRASVDFMCTCIGCACVLCFFAANWRNKIITRNVGVIPNVMVARRAVIWLWNMTTLKWHWQKSKHCVYSRMLSIPSSLNEVSFVVSDIWLKVTKGHRQCHHSVDYISCHFL